ncbi:hypothetical protein BD779DRAFT_1476065 [Infundibulicybe gibba]|nr:hypothetical protein BD779DRAFT_1476065 [Infundibulicybe gibba]
MCKGQGGVERRHYSGDAQRFSPKSILTPTKNRTHTWTQHSKFSTNDITTSNSVTYLLSMVCPSEPSPGPRSLQVKNSQKDSDLGWVRKHSETSQTRPNKTHGYLQQGLGSTSKMTCFPRINPWLIKIQSHSKQQTMNGPGAPTIGFSFFLSAIVKGSSRWLVLGTCGQWEMGSHTFEYDWEVSQVTGNPQVANDGQNRKWWTMVHKLRMYALRWPLSLANTPIVPSLVFQGKTGGVRWMRPTVASKDATVIHTALAYALRGAWVFVLLSTMERFH